MSQTRVLLREPCWFHNAIMTTDKMKLTTFSLVLASLMSQTNGPFEAHIKFQVRLSYDQMFCHFSGCCMKNHLTQ